MNRFGLKLRLLFYSLPLLLQWLPALTWEKDQRALQVAKCALMLFLLFLAGFLASYGIHLLATATSGIARMMLGYIAATLHTLLVLIYIGSSLLLAYEASQSSPARMLPLENLVDKIEHKV